MENPAKYCNIALEYDEDAPFINQALEVVREFIISRGLILYGGLAIDYALRLKGSQIYDDNERPDYDFFSPQNVEDAYDLADILHNRGFRNAGAIRGIHVQTMRVRTDFIGVADISYTPPHIFENLPVLMYRGMKVLHPDYQRNDIHLAFCFPFNSPPREDITHRFAKDLKRFNLIEMHYPIQANGVCKKTEEYSAQKRLGFYERHSFSFSSEFTAISGFAAYALLRKSLDTLARANNHNIADISNIPPPFVEYSYNGSDPSIKLEIDLPRFSPHLVLVSACPEQLLSRICGKRLRVDGICGKKLRVAKYWPFMDIRPAMFSLTDEKGRCRLQVYSVKFRKLAISGIEEGMNIVCVQYLLLYFLHQSHISQGGERALYIMYYTNILKILEHSTAIFQQIQRKLSHRNYMALLDSAPFFLSTRILGCCNEDTRCNYNAAYRIILSTDISRSRTALPEDSILRDDIPDLKTLPSNYYPDNICYRGEQGKPRPTFQYSACPFFQITGHAVCNTK